MDVKLWVPLFAAALTAAIKVWYDIASGIHQRRLERVTAQVEKLYGPLRALVRAGDVAWLDFRRHVRPKQQGFFDSPPPPTPEELDAWILWMTEVFVPLHEKMEAIILEHVHLVEGSAFPDEFDSLLAHISGYKPALAKWKEKGQRDLSADGYAGYLSTRVYPLGLRAYVDRSYETLASRREELLSGPLA